MFSLSRLLRSVTLEISSRCTLRCLLCGFRSGWATSLCSCGIWDSQGSGIEYEITDLLADLSAYGCNFINVKGGDPFIESEVLHFLVTEAVRSGIEVMIHSPGVALKDGDWELIRTTKLSISVPVFGYNEKIHDSISGVPGSFRRLRDTMSKWKNQNLGRLAARVILTHQSFQQEGAIRKWLNEEGIENVEVSVFIPFDECISMNHMASKFILNHFKRSPKDFAVSRETFFRIAKGHQCWQDELAITRKGEIIPCIAARRLLIGNVKTETLLSVLRRKAHISFRDSGRDSFVPCSGCEFRYGCHSCSLMTERIFGVWKSRAWNCTYDPTTGEWGNPVFNIKL